jgi:Protein of unknown function (DUF3035)
MRSATGGFAIAAALLLAACGGGDETPNLMNVRAPGNGPDEFAILPPKPLELPESLEALPPPTLGGANRTDPTPKQDAIVALGGTPSQSNSVPAADGALVSYAARSGISADIRTTLATEDLEFRRDNNGRLLERLFNVNVYFSAYEEQSLDQHAELTRWRRLGARTPSAPPPQDGE